ncbi:nucleotidyltransferase domain-containing protein [Candidatus Woesebacteria bacterium]|nr:nucleotidyltransferase domain-containing protein [Candidatus Woesebacteria bacterium]
MISDSILQTLAYSDHFGFPLTLEEIHTRLVGARYSRLQITTAINKMLKTESICRSGDYYHLPGHSNLVARRENNRQTSLPVFSKAKMLAIKLGHVPGVLAIFLTGSLAMSNSTLDSDIDFMVITKNNRLWTTRFLLTIFTTILGLRRTPHSKSHSAKLCLNLYLSPTSYLLPPDRRSLYTAYELIQAVPLYDPTDTHSQILSANSWIHDYLPNAPKGSDLKGSAQSRHYDERGRSDPIGAVLEFILYHLQLLYMKRKITREYITHDRAFFHPNNPSPKVRPAKEATKGSV